MIVFYKDNPRLIAICGQTKTLVLQEVEKNGKGVVVIEISNTSEITRENGWKRLIRGSIYGCLGLINVSNHIFVAVITGAVSQVAKPVKYETVNKIQNVEFVALNTDQWDSIDSSDINNEDDFSQYIHPCQDLQKLLSNGSFYYSNDFDLTSLLQNRGIDKNRLIDGNNINSYLQESHKEHYQQEYMWNSFLMDELLKFKSNLDPYTQSMLDENKILTTVIRGFAKTMPVSNGTITIISKQSWKRAGTRFNARGIDDYGNVANFVETEFIFQSTSSIFAYTQIRGSVPAFWEQDTTLLNPKITLTRSTEATQPTFNKHFTGIIEKYGVTHIVNLLSKTKSAEVMVSKRYMQLYRGSDRRDEISYTEFDFHAETKQLSGGFSGSSKILPYLYDSMEQFGWFEYNIGSDEVLTRQDGIFRTNCLDCLDRTNLIQQVISSAVVEHIIQKDQSNESQEFFYKHNTIWADNGDAISQIYTGTNALKTSFSRSGKMNFAGALSDVTKSVSRMYQNAFIDGKKQSTMDILLGYDKVTKKIRIYDPVNEYVRENLKKEAGKFTRHEDISIFTGTFNLNNLDPKPTLDLSSWLFPPETTDLPDIFAIGLQELIELNAGSILSADASKPEKWAQIIQRHLNAQGSAQYVLLRTESIASMCMFLFVESSKAHHVTQVSGASKKTGFGGMTANKGACAVRFEFGLTSFVMLTSHLAAGVNATLERYNDYLTIMQGLTFPRNYTVDDHSHVIWLGDLNYRIGLPNEHCRELIEVGAFDELLGDDQLNQEISNKGAFHGFKEGPIKFYPTYKFDKGTSNYDTSEKQRVPSWTDRILYLSEKGKGVDLKLLNYNSTMEICLSDHKPVYATFTCRVEFIDEAKKLALTKQFTEQYKEIFGEKSHLLDFSDASLMTSSNTFESANPIDENDFVPSLPTRPSNTNNKPIPPPPRRVPTGSNSNENQSNNGISSISKSPSATPVRRNVSNISSGVIPIGFSATPLIPSSRSGTPSRTASPISVVNTNTNTISPMSTSDASHHQVKPIVPCKPSSLSATKVAKKQFDSLSPKQSEDSKQSARPLPPPPPPRGVSNNNSGISMSEWKPLIPK